MPRPMPLGRGWTLALKYCGVSLAGFVVDVVILHLALGRGMPPAWARVISLLCAMHLTFFLNARHVFRGRDRGNATGTWARYMLSNGCGNLLNYWLFVTLVSTHWPLAAAPAFAVAASSAAAWVFNFAAARFVVFREWRTRKPSFPRGPGP